jgi:ABC-2 type transport system ATP-binding protein
MIEVQDLSKRYGDKLAVNHLSFTVEPGTVTGFLGPNGAGKSTTMRLIVGLDHPTSGTATIDGKPYADLHQPLRVVGALLEAGALHPGRSAYNHLLFLAQTQALPHRRVDEVIDLVGLHDVARERVGGFSLGMRQRLGIAAALLGDPRVLILDEPINGLDPEGIMWVRTLLRRLADEGRTVLVSSHLMSEMSQTADHLIVIGRGSLIAQSTMAEFIERNSDQSVIVRAPDAAALCRILTEAGGEVRTDDDDGLTVQHLTAARIGDLAAAAGLALHQLSPQLASLEEAFMETTQGSIDFGVAEAPRPEADLVAAGTTEGSTR